MFIGNLCFSFIAGYFFSMIVEVPIIGFENNFLNLNNKKNISETYFKKRLYIFKN